VDTRLEEILSYFSGNKEELIPILQKVQDSFGYLSEDAMREAAAFTGVPESRVYAVATFYKQFRFTPVGKYHIVVCRGTSCHVGGATRILEEIEKHLGITEGGTTPDRQYSLETVACLGDCGSSPCIMVNDKVMANMTPDKIAELFSRGGDR